MAVLPTGRRLLSALPAVLLILCTINTAEPAAEFRQDLIVSSWARELGDRLFRISEAVTRAETIEMQYQEMNMRVEDKDPMEMLDQIVNRIDEMLQRKAEAVKCIVEKVEELAENLNNFRNSSDMEPEDGDSQPLVDEEEVKGRVRREESSGDGMDGEDTDDEEEDILIEFAYHSAKCSPVEIVLEDEEGNTNETKYEDENVTCENDRVYRPMRLKVDRHFYNIPVNYSHSAVHVPTNVYDQAPKFLRWIGMSEGLDEVFVKNYQSDPSLSWQYFGSSVGYLRHFPAMKWKSDPDLFDCRGRPWYVEAASACTKSAVVLVDISGSMTGMRYSIARLTTGALLETFAPNDMVSVITFSEKPDALVSCFKDALVPATRENILAFKQGLSDIKNQTEGYANFTAAFEKAFDLLELNRASRADCVSCLPFENEVLFLITDNVPSNWSTFFEQYNSLHSPLAAMRKNLSDSLSTESSTEEYRSESPLKDNIVLDSDSMLKPTFTTVLKDSEDVLPPVRIVAYLIGKEVFNIREIEKFTCENRGFSVNFQSLDEVKEEVLEYVPLLAKPLALTSADGDYPRPIVWTHTFADVADPKLSRWLWEVMERNEQKERFDAHDRNRKCFFSQEEEDHKYVKKRRKEDDESLGYEYQEYRLMTSVSSPAFIRKIVNITNETDVAAELLGVAGTDVPIDDFLELLHFNEIGVNGYGFAGTTEGNILFHPDLRPVFQGNLKDGFNSVDISEIEIIDTGRGPREFSDDLLKLREGMVNQEKGEVPGIETLSHHDDMRRISSETRNYYYAPLPGTPYTVALSLPTPYGLRKIAVNGEEEIKRFKERGLRDYFTEDNWKINHDWVYCKYLSEVFYLFHTPEERLLHFLQRIQKPEWQWTVDDLLFKASDSSTHCKHAALDKDVYACDKALIELLLADARLTSSFFETKEWELNDEEEKELFNIFHITLRFIGTHSGLTRWQQSSTENENSTSTHFLEHFDHAIDESWYKQSVIWHQHDPGSYIYTMPQPRRGEGEFDQEHKRLRHVTATRAIHLTDTGKTAPASVVGYQFLQSSLQELIENITSNHFCSDEDNSSICSEWRRISNNLMNASADDQLFPSSSSLPSCSSGEVICYVIDGSGYILAVTMGDDNSTEEMSTSKRIGRFFGEVEREVMADLVEVGLYYRRPLFDYQALCIEQFTTSRASFLLIPFYGLQWLFQWAFGQFLWALLKTNLHSLVLPQWAQASVDAYYDSYDDSGLIVPFGKDEEEKDEEEVLRDWRGRIIEKEPDHREKVVTTYVRKSCDKWAYRFSLTTPPPPPSTEAPTAMGYNVSNTFDEDLNYTEHAIQRNTTPVTDALIHQQVWNRWRRLAPSTTTSPTTQQTYNASQLSATEEYENTTKISPTEDTMDSTVCLRPYTAERIHHSDLVLVVISNSEAYLDCIEASKQEEEDLELQQELDDILVDSDEYWNPTGLEMHVHFKEIVYNDTHACQKLRTGKLPRGKKTARCITQHPKEKWGLMTCRGCEKYALNVYLMVLSSVVILMGRHDTLFLT